MFSKMFSAVSGFGIVVTLGASALAEGPAGTPATPKAAGPQKTATTAKPVATKNVQVSAEGEPDWRAGDVTGAWVWRDDKGEHVRFRAKVGETHTFTGSVCAKDIQGVARIDLEDGDKAAIVKHKSCIDLALKSDASADGVDFTGAGQSARINFRMDGKAMPLASIHLGKDLASPASNSFRIRLENATK
ncbi:MAG: hypothetical protein U1F43_03120 [Myxococcota bacterium]